MDRLEHARALRADKDKHYNCCQSVLVPFAKEMGMTEGQAYALGAHFGSGIRHGSACGAFVGSMMVLGALGYDQEQALAHIRQFKSAHGDTACSVLLKTAHDQGIPRTEHCDGLVYEMVEALEFLLQK